ncbi:MAG: hypothetical protein EBW35_01930 [Rhodobacterales bacterium]|nr:hypothetical protein [Rhodobacterales bacterium]
MHFGYYISGFAHLGLLMGLLIGPIFQKDVEPVEYSSVSLISEQEFIDLTASNISPKVSEKASELTPLDENEDKLDLLFNKESEVLKSEGPDVILDEPLEPVIKKPDVEIALTEKVGKPAPITQPEVEVSQTLENITKSVDKLSVTEKKENSISDSLVSSLKPKSRPPRVSKPNFENKSESKVIEAEVSDAMQKSMTQNTLSKPLTETETENLQAAIEACWLRDPGSLAEDVKLTVLMALDRNGRVNPNSIQVIEISGGDENAQKVAFRRAKIAIISCGKNGYKLPPNKYERWREIEVVFDPTN